MTHRRMKPTNAIRTYGVLVGHVLQGREFGGGASPHYEILVQADSEYRIAVNVRSVDGSDVLAYLDPDFSHPTRPDLAALAAARGFTPLSTGPDGQGLDYLRDGLFPVGGMVAVPPAQGSGALAPQLDAQIATATADAASVVLAFGEFFQDSGADQTFGFSPEKGVHDIHMMQGNSGSFADDNRVRGDGALFLRAGNGHTVALFVRFSTQSIDTDPQTGNPVSG
jgi:uncharacterized protein YukJ